MALETISLELTQKLYNQAYKACCDLALPDAWVYEQSMVKAVVEECCRVMQEEDSYQGEYMSLMLRKHFQLKE